MAEPVQRRTREDGSKFYEHPHRTEEIPQPGGGTLVRPRQYRSVTNVLSVCAKPALVYWAGNTSAARAMENLPKLIGAARRETCGRARARTEPLGCGECCDCVEYWVALAHHGEKERRAREGTCAHDILEWWILTGEWAYKPREDHGEYAPTADEMAPYMAALQAFIRDYGLTREAFLVAECTIWSHTFGYAGTLDFIVDIRAVTKAAAELCARINAVNGVEDLAAMVRVLGDCKSREGEGAQLYQEQPLQLGAYRYAETMTPKHAAAEMEAEMFATDAAAILQVRPDGYTFRPVVTDGRTMKAFRAVLDLHAWTDEHGDRSTQVQAFPKPAGWKWTPPKPVLAPSAKLGVGDPDDKPKPARKRAAPKKTVSTAGPVAGQTGMSTTTAAIIAHQRLPGHIDDSAIPF